MLNTFESERIVEDIVERLMAHHQRQRERGGDMMSYGPGEPLVVEAAQEIGRLRSDLATARRLGWQPDSGSVCTDPAPHASRPSVPTGKTGSFNIP